MSLANFEARQSDDLVKTDLELTCTECGEVLCDIEPGDSMEVLVSMTGDHICEATEDVVVVIDSPGVVCGGCGITIHDTATEIVTCVICGHQTEVSR